MNCLYITLFFNVVAGIVQTCIQSLNQLLYPRVIEACCQPFEPRHDFLHLIVVVELFPSEMLFLGEETSGNVSSSITTESGNQTFTFCVQKSYDGTHLAFGGTLDRRCQFKHVSLKQSRFYHCQTSTAHK